MQKVMLRWYDEISREGIFVDTELNRIFANFELEDYSHEIALKAKTGDVFEALIVRDVTFTQIARLVA